MSIIKLKRLFAFLEHFPGRGRGTNPIPKRGVCVSARMGMSGKLRFSSGLQSQSQSQTQGVKFLMSQVNDDTSLFPFIFDNASGPHSHDSSLASVCLGMQINLKQFLFWFGGPDKLIKYIKYSTIYLYNIYICICVCVFLGVLSATPKNKHH